MKLLKTNYKYIVLITILSVSLFSCCKDDDNIQNDERTTQELLIGKWHYDVLPTGDATACEAETFYQFLDSESVRYQSVRDYTGFLYVPGQGEVIGDCFYNNQTLASYTIIDDQEIIIDNSSRIHTLNIVSINTTTLVITKQGVSGDDTIVLKKEI